MMVLLHTKLRRLPVILVAMDIPISGMILLGNLDKHDEVILIMCAMAIKIILIYIEVKIDLHNKKQ